MWFCDAEKTDGYLKMPPVRPYWKPHGIEKFSWSQPGQHAGACNFRFLYFPASCKIIIQLPSFQRALQRAERAAWSWPLAPIEKAWPKADLALRTLVCFVLCDQRLFFLLMSRFYSVLDLKSPVVRNGEVELGCCWVVNRALLVFIKPHENLFRKRLTQRVALGFCLCKSWVKKPGQLWAKFKPNRFIKG
jgi:hypothetical protein